MRKLTGVKWSNTSKVWHLPDNDAYRKQFNLPTLQVTTKSQPATKEPSQKQLTPEIITKVTAYKNWLRSR